jgi:hypothetical protein
MQNVNLSRLSLDKIEFTEFLCIFLPLQRKYERPPSALNNYVRISTDLTIQSRDNMVDEDKILCVNELNL